MSYRIAGIDVHKKMLAVVVADVGVQGEYQFERRLFGSNPDHLRLLANWLIEQQVEEVVMESTAQYWKPVWGALEQHWKPTGQKREDPAWVWIQRSRSLPKWVPRPRHSLRPSTSLPGSERAQERTRAREYPRATAPRRATAICGAFSISVPTPQPSRKEPFSRSSMADWSRAWDIIKPSGPLPIGFVA